MKSAKQTALRHISKYIIAKAKDKIALKSYSEPITHTIGKYFVSSSMLNTKENRRLNKQVLSEYM
jgi:hypothetical protein